MASELTGPMKDALRIAQRDGAVCAGGSEERGRRTWIFPNAVKALERRGLVTLDVGPDGTTMGRITDEGRAFVVASP